MPARLPWIKRRWKFDFPAEVFPDVIERIRGTPARVEEMLREVRPEVLTRRQPEGGWSIQENVGHLVEVEALFMGRLDDYAAGEDTLRAADMTNRRTHQANYNEKPVAAVLAAFRAVRARLVARLDSLPDEDFGRSARHPRLDVPMRLVDMCVFVADHDDYHLARLRELLRLFQPG